MMRRTLLIRRAALAVAIGGATAVLGHLLLTPVTGDVLLLLTARQADRVAATSVDLHSAQGWMGLGSIPARAVPKAPETVEAFLARVPVGSYDRVRLAGISIPVALLVQKDILNPLLVGVEAGRPLQDSAYGGTQAVSLGLNELSGQLKPMPPFNLVDQFGRPFTNADIAGHDVLVAAFHTSCRETCPLVTGLFLQLRKRLPPSVMLVEATVTPSQDTPAVLREYAGRVGASWAFVTGDPVSLAAFWAPFHVGLDTSDSHISTLALIDSHGYIRTYFLGAPDIGGTLAAPLDSQLDYQGRQLLTSRGNGWGEAQILDALQAVGGLAAPSSAGQGPAPSFNLETLDGKRVSLADYRGKPVLINFWATYCAPCRHEMPLIERTAAQHPGLVVLLIDERDSRQSASVFVNQLQITSTVLFDGDGKVGDSYGISGLPTTFFIRPNGEIEGRYIGETNAGILGPHISAIGA
ncbi:MAG TPA: redoxin domain-containing protein [Candidatus Dormibacteraeota bacterium]|nr:redoxin domain-containing protein [Candidatus Dormibacteraeota bacterium]